MKVWVLTPAAKVNVCVVRAVKSATSAVSGEAKVIVETSTVCEMSEVPVRVTVKVARPPSLTVTSATLKTGRSSSNVPVVVAPVVLSGYKLPVPSSLMLAIPVADVLLALVAVSVKVSVPS